MVASDINSEVIAEAKEGIYSERSIKEVPESFKAKYFRPYEGSRNRMWKEFALDDSIKSGVKFVQHNLLKPFSESNFDVIFLRNVMIYFDSASKQKVVDSVLASLAPGGYFFISLSESLTDVKTSLKMVSSGIYQK
jgi:chemotaxis protein methyltransferase CheR